MEGLAVRKDSQPTYNKLETLVKFGEKPGFSFRASPPFPTKAKRRRSILLKIIGGQLQFSIAKTHNPLIISGKKAEIKLTFISVNQKKGEICHLVLRNQWFFS